VGAEAMQQYVRPGHQDALQHADAPGRAGADGGYILFFNRKKMLVISFLCKKKNADAPGRAGADGGYM
jgi:hypothetical protein